ncbi:hypothetical protein HNP11_004159 [Tsukamurella ocularis]|uniref:hypothetical protein n=1 Tax=Tsukamurella ocularis TaxID=1970234 RepID=UPI00216A2DC3|nr:hypothetical protein [Tsukamurella ocularis]MCS3789961.1 hypothetical protein [Tsukamurella ocularis]
MSGRESFSPATVRGQSTGLQGHVTTSTTAARGTVAALSTPVAATGPIGAAIQAATGAVAPTVEPAIAAAEGRATSADDATQTGVGKIEAADGRGGARFRPDRPDSLDAASIEADARTRAQQLTGNDPATQAGQVATQVGAGILQAGAQGFQQVAQLFQQIPQQTGQGVQQVGQLMSGLAEKGDPLSTSTTAGVDDAGVGAGVDPGVDLGGGAGLGGDDFAGIGGGGVGGDTGTDPDTPAQVGGASIGPAVMPIGVGGGGAPVATPTSGMPMGGMPMAPMMGRPGGGTGEGSKRSELTGESAIYDERTHGLPVVEQVIGGVPSILLEEPSWTTETVGGKK